MGDQQSVDQLAAFSCRYMGYILLRYHANPLTCNMRLSSDAFALGEGPTRLGIISHWLSYRCDELCLFEALYPAPLARPFSKGLLAGIISHRLSCRYGELCLFEALYPAPLARPFSKGLLEGIISHGLSCRCDELCLFEALYPAPLARPFSKGLLEGGIF